MDYNSLTSSILKEKFSHLHNVRKLNKQYITVNYSTNSIRI